MGGFSPSYSAARIETMREQLRKFCAGINAPLSEADELVAKIRRQSIYAVDVRRSHVFLAARAALGIREDTYKAWTEWLSAETAAEA